MLFGIFTLLFVVSAIGQDGVQGLRQIPMGIGVVPPMVPDPSHALCPLLHCTPSVTHYHHTYLLAMALGFWPNYLQEDYQRCCPK